jgi:hypothetical protein
MMDHVKHQSLRSAESERDSSVGSDKTRLYKINILAKRNLLFGEKSFGPHSSFCPPDYNRHVMANICMLSTFMRSYSHVTNL